MIEIEAFPASYGQSILVSIGAGENKKNILIDTGFSSTYNNHIKDRLIELNKNNNILDLLIFTHFDADHISGGISLLRDNISNEKSNIIKIKNIWINKLSNIQSDFFESENITENDRAKLLRLLSKKYPLELYTTSLNNISAEQCLTIADLIENGGYKTNKEALVYNKENLQYNIEDNIKITIISPTENKLNKLEKIWLDELSRLDIKNKLKMTKEVSDAFEKFIVNYKEQLSESSIKNCSSMIDLIESISNEDKFKEDESTVNGSSLAIVIEYNDKRVMILGDSHCDVIEEYIKEYLKNSNDKRMKFDLINISHHGSNGNTSRELLELVDCPKFLICTNGKRFNHPDKETLVRIIRNNNTKKIIYLNYKTDSIKKFLNKDLMEKYNYKIEYTNEATTINKRCKITKISI